MTLKTQSVRGPTVENIRVNFDSNRLSGSGAIKFTRFLWSSLVDLDLWPRDLVNVIGVTWIWCEYFDQFQWNISIHSGDIMRYKGEKRTHRQMHRLTDRQTHSWTTDWLMPLAPIDRKSIINCHNVTLPRVQSHWECYNGVCIELALQPVSINQSSTAADAAKCDQRFPIIAHTTATYRPFVLLKEISSLQTSEPWYTTPYTTPSHVSILYFSCVDILGIAIVSSSLTLHCISLVQVCVLSCLLTIKWLIDWLIDRRYVCLRRHGTHICTQVTLTDL